ncbi:MAG: hypothetical protein ACOX7I_07935 [Oscillospiraceae bacterium]
MRENFSDMIPGIGFYATVLAYIPQRLYIPILILSILLYGPVKMGVTYVFRNFAREEHAWLSDVFSRALSNLKQGLFFGILDFVVVTVLLNSIFVGYTSEITTGIVIAYILKYLSIFFLVVYLFMRHYFYIMAVTVELSVFAIIKNAWLFTVLGFGRNILTSISCIVIWCLTLFTLPLVTVAALPLFTYSLCGFATVFVCYPIVKKYIIVPALELEKAAKLKEQSEGSLEDGNK